MKSLRLKTILTKEINQRKSCSKKLSKHVATLLLLIT